MANDFILDIKGVEGESQQKGFEGKIDVDSYSIGCSNSGSFHLGPGGGKGKVSYQDFHFSMTMNKASGALQEACATGKHFDTAVLTLREQGDPPVVYMKYTMTKVLVSSYSDAASSHGDSKPMCSFSLNFAKIQTEYSSQSEKGRVTGTASKVFDVAKGVAE